DYVALGSTDTLSQKTNAAPTVGTSSLSVSGRLVDLVGNLDLSGFRSTTIASAGDLRTVGVQLANQVQNGFVGSLTTLGALALSAQQIYPTTLTSYSIQVLDQGVLPSRLTIEQPAAQTPAGAVLSAAGSLALAADEIDDSGVLRAPIGTLSLQGKKID